MKRLTIIAMVLMASNLFAQSESGGSNIQSGVSSLRKKDDKLILFLSSDSWTKLPTGITSSVLGSRGFSFDFMNEKMNSKGTVGIGTGLGFMSQNVQTNAFIDQSKSDSASALVRIPDSVNYSINKLSLNYLTATFELRFRTNENKKGKRFKFNFGIKGALLLQSHTKYSDDSIKVKTYHIKNLNDFQYGGIVRIGYGKFALIGYYSFADVFKKGKGPELAPYSIGIGLAL